MLHDKVVPLMRRHYERGTTNRDRRFCKMTTKRFGPRTNFHQKMNFDLDDSHEIKIKPSCDRSFLTFRNIWWSFHPSILFMDIGYGRIS